MLEASADEVQLDLGDAGRKVDSGLFLNRDGCSSTVRNEPPTNMLAPIPPPTVTSAEALA
jgi:hypothetical protein